MTTNQLKNTENIVYTNASAEDLGRDVLACVLRVNSLKLEVHETFSNLPEQLALIDKIVKHYGGYLELHPDIFLKMKMSKA